ncbi:MAG: 4Fe-4S cluster-binding domain-containing protein [Verrucomicrobiota bacterium]
MRNSESRENKKGPVIHATNPKTSLPPEPRQVIRSLDGKIFRQAIEYCVVDHCNLRCAGCDHASPHLSRRFADWHAFAADIEALGPHMHARVLRLVGGEPLLHPNLPAFVERARAVGIADEVWLWSNGLLLHAMPRELLEQFDVIRVSIYPGVSIRANLTQLQKDLAARRGTKLEMVTVNKFMHQLLNHPVADSDRTRETFLRCKETHVWSCHTVHEGRYYKCTKPALLRQRLANCGIQISSVLDDGVALHSNPSLREDLEAYLLSKTPLKACAWCLGTDGKRFAHHQLTATELDQERLQRTPAKSLLAHPLQQVMRDIRDSLYH